MKYDKNIAHRQIKPELKNSFNASTNKAEKNGRAETLNGTKSIL